MAEGGGAVGTLTTKRYGRGEGPIRSIMLHQEAAALVNQSGVMIEETPRRINVEGEGWESLLRYRLPDGQVFEEFRILGTFCLGLINIEGKRVPNLY